MTSALTFRRRALIWTPATAAVLIVAGYFLDPDIGASGREMAKAYAENPGRIQLSALSFHFAFALLIVPTFILIGLVRGRGAWLANVAGVFAVLGMTTLPGFLMTDFYDVAIYGELGGDAWDVVDGRLEELPGAMVMFMTGYLGFVLALPLALMAASRAGLLAWWPAVALLAATVAGRVVPNGLGLLLWAAALVAVAYALRGTRHRRESRVAPAAHA